MDVVARARRPSERAGPAREPLGRLVAERTVRPLAVVILSKSRVAEMAKELDRLVAAFRRSSGCRDGGRVVNVATVTAIGVNAEGYARSLRRDHQRR